MNGPIYLQKLEKYVTTPSWYCQKIGHNWKTSEPLQNPSGAEIKQPLNHDRVVLN